MLRPCNQPIDRDGRAAQRNQERCGARTKRANGDEAPGRFLAGSSSGPEVPLDPSAGMALRCRTRNDRPAPLPALELRPGLAFLQLADADVDVLGAAFFGQLLAARGGLGLQSALFLGGGCLLGQAFLLDDTCRTDRCRRRRRWWRAWPRRQGRIGADGSWGSPRDCVRCWSLRRVKRFKAWRRPRGCVQC